MLLDYKKTIAEKYIMNAGIKKKFTSLLEVKGIMSEMGVTPVTAQHILHIDSDEPADYWYIETEDIIDGKITNFIKWNIKYYMFAFVKDEDYENGKYAVGAIEELKDYRNPAGIHEENDFMTLTYDEMIAKIRP